jgi:hypothetical protein
MKQFFILTNNRALRGLPTQQNDDIQFVSDEQLQWRVEWIRQKQFFLISARLMKHVHFCNYDMQLMLISESSFRGRRDRWKVQLPECGTGNGLFLYLLIKRAFNVLYTIDFLSGRKLLSPSFSGKEGELTRSALSHLINRMLWIAKKR